MTIAKIVIRLGIIFSFVLVECSDNLDRNKAFNIIQEKLKQDHARNDVCNAYLPRTIIRMVPPDVIRCLAQRGMIGRRISNKKEELFLTKKGIELLQKYRLHPPKNKYDQFNGGTWGDLKNSAVSCFASVVLKEITGITYQDGLAQVEFTIVYEDTTPFGECYDGCLSCLPNPHSASAILQKYDDGWRVKSIEYKEN